MIGVFQKSQEIEKTRQEFVKVKCTLFTWTRFQSDNLSAISSAVIGWRSRNFWLAKIAI